MHRPLRESVDMIAPVTRNEKEEDNDERNKQYLQNPSPSLPSCGVAVQGVRAVAPNARHQGNGESYPFLIERFGD